MAGYSAQVKLLEEIAAANGWANVLKTMTVDSSQGSEKEIVILCLVTTRGYRES